MPAMENFKRIDLFGQDVRLLVKGQQTFRTPIGALMTLTLCSLLAYSCNSFILEMNKGKNAILNQKQAILDNNEGYNFNSTDFIFAVGLLDAYGQPIPNSDDKKVFSVIFYFCTKSLNQTVCDYIPSVICGDRIKKASQEMNVPESYSSITYCMDENYLANNPIIRFQGSERQDNFTLLGAIIETCYNRTEFETCASKEDIATYIKNSNLYYSYSSFEFNKELDNQPYELVQSLDITPLYEKVRKYVKIYYQYSQSQLEFNPFYWFPTYVSRTAAEYEQTIIDQALNFNDDGSLAQIEISLDAKKKLYFITYQTLMDVAAKIGGFFTILKMLFDILLFPIQQLIYRLYLVNFLIVQQHSINTNETPKSHKTSRINFLQLLCRRNARQHFSQSSQTIEKLLDITEVLFNPLRLTRQVEDLYGSMKKLDSGGGGKLNTYNQINRIIDEFAPNNDIIDLKSMSPRTINQEIRFGSLTNFIVPRLQIR